MKLTLVQHQGIEVLTGTGEISGHDLQVLRAGLVKLLKSGKNRIVLELPEASSIPTEVLAELSKFDLLARELSGRIVLSGVSPSVRAQIARHAKPPVIECFDQLKDALAYFRPSGAIDENLPTQPSAAAAPAPSPEDGEKHLKAKTEIRDRELAGLNELRKKIADLENENQLLQDRLIAAITERRAYPPKDSTQAARLQSLEERLDDIVRSLNAMKPGSAPS